MTYEEAKKALYDAARYHQKTTFDNIRGILEELSHPERDLTVIQVAGTNGKGSVCAFLDSIFCLSGKTTGVFTSPHLVSIRERICIGSTMISRREFASAAKRVFDAASSNVEKGGRDPSFFEILFLMSLVYFQKKKPDYCIIEAGMGGGRDITSLLQPKLSILTVVGLDHTEFFGDTLKEIAKEKAGVMKPGILLCTCPQEPVVETVLKKTADKIGTQIIRVSEKYLIFLKNRGKDIDFFHGFAYDNDNVLKVGLMGAHQVQNAALAVAAAKQMEPFLSWEIIESALFYTRLSGRMEEVAPGIIIDTAHNPQAVRGFCRTAQAYFPGKKFIFFAVSHKNEEEEMLVCLKELEGCTGIFKVQVDNKMIDAADFKAGVNQLMKHRDEDTTCFCLGSFYLAGMIKRYFAGGK